MGKFPQLRLSLRLLLIGEISPVHEKVGKFPHVCPCYPPCPFPYSPRGSVRKCPNTKKPREGYPVRLFSGVSRAFWGLARKKSPPRKQLRKLSLFTCKPPYMHLRFCPYCEQQKPASGFIKWKKRCADCRSEQGKAIKERAKTREGYTEAHRARSRAYYWENRDKVRTKRRIDAYGISPGQYEELLTSQGEKCAICGESETARNTGGKTVKTLAVDHCHKTGKVRGLLCHKCNTGLGSFCDDVSKLEKARVYLCASMDSTSANAAGLLPLSG